MMFGVSSMTAPLRRVAVRAPGPSMLQADATAWHYGAPFDPDKVPGNHAAFVGLLEEAGADVIPMNGEDRGIADAVFTYDASLVTPKGAILMNPGKKLRAGEQEVHRTFYAEAGIPIIGEISGDGHMEAGDTLWLDDTVLAVGRGFRTNQAGVDQLAELLRPMGIAVHAFDLPVYTGAEACLHLMSLVSLLDTRKALVFAPLMPVGLWRLMQDMDFTMIEAPEAEFTASGTLSLNILATAPGQCIMIGGYPETKAAMEEGGIEVRTFDGTALCVGCEGGPTCMTRPILRG